MEEVGSLGMNGWRVWLGATLGILLLDLWIGAPFFFVL